MEKRGSVTQVEIFGQTYNVRAEGDSTYIHDLARLVDSRMKEVAERTDFRARAERLIRKLDDALEA